MFSGEFIVDFNEYVGDFDLILTMNSGQTSQPPWKMDDNNYYEIILIDNIDVLVKISQEKLNDPLIVKYFSKEEFNVEKLRTKLFYIFDLDYNINETGWVFCSGIAWNSFRFMSRGVVSGFRGEWRSMGFLL